MTRLTARRVFRVAIDVGGELVVSVRRASTTVDALDWLTDPHRPALDSSGAGVAPDDRRFSPEVVVTRPFSQPPEGGNGDHRTKVVVGACRGSGRRRQRGRLVGRTGVRA
jgi:hypothetical protein